MKNVLSDANLVSWLEPQDPEEGYDYADTNNCLAARYCHDFGLTYSADKVVVDSVNSFRGRLEHVAVETPWTYGAALARARILTESISCNTS